MTHWDDPATGSWDDSYGELRRHRDDPPASPRASGRHAASGDPEPDSFGPPAPFNGFTPASSADSTGGFPAHTDGWGIPVQPARPVSPARPAFPNRPVSPAADARNFPPPPPPPPSRPVSPARFPVSPGPRSGPPAQGFGPGFGPGPVSGGPYDAGGRRSHWVDESGVDHRGRLIIDPDDVDYSERSGDSGLNRRRALLALGTVVAGTAAVLSPPGLNLVKKLFGGPAALPDALSHDTLPGGGSDRPAGRQPSTVRTYTDQNESYMGSTAGDKVRKTTPTAGTTAAAPAQAAALPQAKPVAVSALGTDAARHLASRLTFGPTPRVLAEINKVGIDQWVGTQLAPETIADTRAEQKLAELTSLGRTIDELRASRTANDAAGVAPDQEVVLATIARQIWSDRQLLEVMVDFWNDFLHVAAFFDGAEIQRPSFDRDVIRKYALDNYPDMFVAANRHPALLTYLNQNQSREGAVNENLARENLELYTVGVDGGYTEVHVRQAALLQTGRSVSADKYVYRPEFHHVGPIEILDFKHPNATAAGGEAASEEYFRYLALHKSTAHYIAQSLATRLVSDTPPVGLVERVAAAYLANKGQIKPTLVTLLSSTEFWGSVGQKVRRPMEYVVATHRTLGVQADTPAGYAVPAGSRGSAFLQGLQSIRNKMEEMGQFPLGQPTPNGYPDAFVAWTSAGTFVNGWNEAYDVVNGRRPQFTYVAPEQLLGTTPPATAGAYVDALAMRLVYQPLSDIQRGAILSVAGPTVTADTRVPPNFNGAIKAIVRTILATPQHHLR